MKATPLVAAALLAAFALDGLAQTSSTSRIDRRQADQQRRIDEGVRSGRITPREEARLRRGQNHVQRLENRAAADGRISKRERARIAAAQDRQSLRITRDKHNLRRN